MIRNVVCIADLHAGCRLALYPLDADVPLDEGSPGWRPSPPQRVLWSWWREFWDSWVPAVTQREPYAVVVVGDAIDGVHHDAVSQISHNLTDQGRIAEALLAPVRRRARCGFWVIRGTQAHGGSSGQYEESLAKTLRARPNEFGQYARWELWLRVAGRGGGLVHFAHHIGTAGSSHYESSALTRELSESFVEAGRWNDEPPRVIVRAHRHRGWQERISGAAGDFIGLILPGWQLKTPLAYRIPGARQSQPQVGGAVIRLSREGELFARLKVWRLARPREEA